MPIRLGDSQGKLASGSSLGSSVSFAGEEMVFCKEIQLAQDAIFLNECR